MKDRVRGIKNRFQKSGMLALGFWVALGSSGCGYSLQNTKNPMLEREGVRRVYVAPLENNSYKPGVENLVFNQVLRTFAAYGQLRIVDDIKQADAILKGAVTDAGYGPAGQTSADKLFPVSVASSFGNRETEIRRLVPAAIPVATEYNAGLACAFRLVKNDPKLKTESVLWSGGFSRGKTFPGNNQLGSFGTTSALINESEFDRSLRDLAQSIASDLHESMLVMF